MASTIDLNFSNHGTIFLMSSATPTGKAWVDEHIDPEAASLGDSIAVEHRCAAPIISGALVDGLTVAIDGREVVLGGAN